MKKIRNKKLYKEFYVNNDQLLTPKQQENYNNEGTYLIEANQDEIDNAKDLFKKNKKCEHHLVYDKAGFVYDFRFCGICGKEISII